MYVYVLSLARRGVKYYLRNSYFLSHFFSPRGRYSSFVQLHQCPYNSKLLTAPTRQRQLRRLFACVPRQLQLWRCFLFAFYHLLWVRGCRVREGRCQERWAMEHSKSEGPMPYWIWEASNCWLERVDPDKLCRMMQGRKGIIFVGEFHISRPCREGTCRS